MIHPLKKFWQFLFVTLWRTPLEKLRPLRRALYRGMRFVFVLGRDLSAGELSLHATGLVYTTLLALAPLLAVSFSVLTGMGAHNFLEPALREFLEPLGEEGDEVVTNIISFVEAIDVRVLGSVGLLFLLFTVVSLIQKVEESFNFVWRTRRLRSAARRFSDYLSVILVGPVLVFSAMGLTATVMSTTLAQWLMELEPIGTVIVFTGQLIPTLIVIAAFTFVYRFVPNTRVHLLSALIGGAVAGVVWQLLGFGFAWFAATSVRYSAIYAGFASLIFFMLWLYLSWLVLLFGAQIAFYHQHPQQVRPRSGQLLLSNRFSERLGFILMYLITDAWHRERPLWSADTLAQQLRLPGDAIGQLLELLLDRGLLVEVGSDPPVYVPARDPERLSLERLRQELRSANEQDLIVEPGALTVPTVEQLMERAEQGAADALAGLTLRDLIEQEGKGRVP